ncbi:NAD(P)-linked oxidoreductase superfamily protein [Hibiscus syriacus]|uniref:NAD(P)-linked oxidoreductase superfamily protein n=1 Tax=Hibiscus syriacus TaxID=106335 RepID=A0A6A3BBY9_HIBSY|nr:NAD(P)-linked oxidoreductase superfamily protein [Hibiscus syriacus]
MATNVQPKIITTKHSTLERSVGRVSRIYSNPDSRDIVASRRPDSHRPRTILDVTKTVALAVVLGPGGFLRRPGYVVDGVVVIGALVLEAVVEAKGGGLLVIEGIVCQFEELRDENSRLLETIARKDEIIEMMEKEVDQFRHARNPNTTVSVSVVPTDHNIISK